MSDEVQVTFREATAGDLEAVLRVMADDDLRRGSARLDAVARGAYEDAFAAIASNPNDAVIVGEVEGEIVATCQLTFLAGLSRGAMWRGQIESVHVARSHRGRGIGSQMMQWVIRRCRERGCGLVQLTTDKRRERAHSFYLSLGFEASHEGMKLIFKEPSGGNA